MKEKNQHIHRVRVVATSVFVGVVLASASLSFARVDGQTIIPLKAAVPAHSVVRVGYVDFGLPDIPTSEMDFYHSRFSRIQQVVMTALASQQGLLMSVVGADETMVFYNYLENLREYERLNQSAGDVEFGRRKTTDSEKHEQFDLRALIDDGEWNTCDYEVHIKVSDWDSERISTRVNLFDNYTTLDSWIQSAEITMTLIDLGTGKAIYSLVYQVAGDDMPTLIWDVARDFAAHLERATWKQWIEQEGE